MKKRTIPEEDFELSKSLEETESGGVKQLMKIPEIQRAMELDLSVGVGVGVGKERSVIVLVL